MKNLSTKALTLPSRTQPTQKPKHVKECAFPGPKKKLNFFSPTPKEKIKTPDTQANDNADRH